MVLIILHGMFVDRLLRENIKTSWSHLVVGLHTVFITFWQLVLGTFEKNHQIHDNFAWNNNAVSF